MMLGKKLQQNICASVLFISTQLFIASTMRNYSNAATESGGGL